MSETILKTIDPTTDTRWDDFVTRHPGGTIFHHSAIARVLADRYGHAPGYYVLENESGQIVAGMPLFHIKSRLTGKRIVCLPACEYCYPLAYSEQDLGELVRRAKEEVDRGLVSYLEIRGWGDCSDPLSLGLKANPYYLSHIVELDKGPEALRARMTRNGRYNLRYAEKQAINVRLGQDENDLKTLHRLSTDTRRRLNLLPQPYNFFRSIYQHLIIPGLGYIFLAEVGGKVISASIFLCFKGTVMHQISAQDRDYFEYRANYLLVRKVIERACQESYHHYDFGCTHPENENLANFKRHWGSKETTLPYYYYPAVQGMRSVRHGSLLYRAHTAINRCLPGFVSDYTGAVLFKHMG